MKLWRGCRPFRRGGKADWAENRRRRRQYGVSTDEAINESVINPEEASKTAAETL